MPFDPPAFAAPHNIRYYAAIDGGGTSCRIRLVTHDGQHVADARGGPANLRLGIDAAWRQILSLIWEVFPGDVHSAPDLSQIALGVGLAGITCARDADALIAANPGFAYVRASSDIHIACLGAFGGGDGGIVIAGTGSSAYVLHDGLGRQVGGWGFAICDEGSGASLGRDTIRQTLRAYDGLIDSTPLTREVMAMYDNDPVNLVDWSDTARPKDYGKFAPICLRHAEAGDELAKRLVEQSCLALETYILRLHALGAPKVCLFGGLADIIAPALSERVQPYISTPQADALQGALALAQGASTGFKLHERVEL